MSDTTEDGAAAADAEDARTIAAARRMGWKPREEFDKPPEKWKPAGEFLQTGFGSPAVLAERYQALDDRYGALTETARQTETRLGDAMTTIGELTAMMRANEKRTYERARRELLAEREKAVETGDTANFRRVDTELQELKPLVVEPPRTTTAPNLPPEVSAFYGRNPWYMANRELQIEADIIHTGLRSARPDLSLSQNLAEVERRMAPLVSGGGRRVVAEPEPPAETDNTRRTEAAAVTPSGTGAARAPRGRFTFDGMPKDAKDAYARYAKMLVGKGEPLTKEEYSRDYWAQFQDDGA